MNKKLRILVLICYAVGQLTLSLSSMFRDNLSDFAMGFCEGVSVVFIFIGLIYFGWCIYNKKNPFGIEKGVK
ncbi:MAG: hypothetical protein K0R15_298 [Clostridiales bacterium]|jgi:hypothetical protein|nr:hypothetical protein [Clostridiales bacterium]